MPKIRRPTFKYLEFHDATPDMRFDYLSSGMSVPALQQKYHKLVMGGVTVGQVRHWARTSKLKAIKTNLDAERHRALDRAKNEVRVSATREAKMDREPLARAAAEELVTLERQAQRKHMERIGELHDKSYQVIAAIEPEAKNIAGFVGLIDHWDKVGRRIYNLDKAQEVTPHQRNIAILIGCQGLPDAIEV